eukprot:scaffold1928_cov381-Prasinococcus_capsulatus_cf.AAC.24
MGQARSPSPGCCHAPLRSTGRLRSLAARVHVRCRSPMGGVKPAPVAQQTSARGRCGSRGLHAEDDTDGSRPHGVVKLNL